MADPLQDVQSGVESAGGGRGGVTLMLSLSGGGKDSVRGVSDHSPGIRKNTFNAAVKWWIDGEDESQ